MQIKDPQLKKYRFKLITTFKLIAVKAVMAKFLSGSMITGRPPNNNTERSTHTESNQLYRPRRCRKYTKHRVSMSRLRHHLGIKKPTYPDEKHHKSRDAHGNFIHDFISNTSNAVCCQHEKR
jgi:hypothetical protein